jgi:hypothetical protein
LAARIRPRVVAARRMDAVGAQAHIGDAGIDVARMFKAPVLKTGREFRSLVSLTPSAGQVEIAGQLPIF